MTSPSRKKRPTTVPSTRPETERSVPPRSHAPRGNAIARRSASICHQATTLIALLATIAVAANASAAELQWRHGGPAASHATSTSSTTQPHRDNAVAPAAYDAEQTGAGPKFGNEPISQAALRSVVVHRDDQATDGDDETFRSAQRSYGEGNTPPSDSRYDQQLRSPFGDTTPGSEPQGMKEDTLPLPPVEGAPSELSPPTENGPNMPESQSPPPTMPQYQQPTKQRQQNNNAETQPRTFQPQRPTQTTRPHGSHDPFDGEPQTGTAPTQPSPLGIAGGSHLEPEVLKAEQGKARQFCSDELAKEKATTLHDVDLTISVPGTQGEDYPFECTIDEGAYYNGRCWDQITYMWKASCLCHKPLYFEDEGLERYGHSWGPCCDPLVSGAHFFCTLPVLPYCMGVTPPCECMYALGHYRPGSCAPYMINPVPLSCRGAAGEAGAVAGAIWFLP